MSKLSAIVWLIAVCATTYWGYTDPQVGFLDGFFLSLVVGLVAVLVVVTLRSMIKGFFKSLVRVQAD